MKIDKLCGDNGNEGGKRYCGEYPQYLKNCGERNTRKQNKESCQI